MPCGASLEGLLGFRRVYEEQAVEPESVFQAYGHWIFSMWQTNDIERPRQQDQWVGYAEVLFRVAQDCEAEEVGFVPEPGSMLLLGSGLAGLAGYASFRLRTR
jgi:hypothetical protein